MKNIKPIILLLYILPLYLYSFQEDRLDSIANSIDPYLYEIKTVNLQNDSVQIDLRMLHFNGGYEHVASEIVFQWIKSDEKGQKIIDQLYFKEAGNRFWSMRIDKIEKMDDGIYLEISATHTYVYTSRIFIIKIDRVGEYDTLNSNFEVKLE